MDELAELADFVRQNPDDHNQRWRLAKKLYGAWEYRPALDHLKTLKTAWPNQQNVIYYLATTHYRMGNYDEAIAELEAMLEIYPSDVSLRRLLARICEASGRVDEAKKAYREVLMADPSPSVENAVARLGNMRDSGARSTMAEVSPADEISYDKTMVTCRYCDAPNDAFLDRCVQCHASLSPDVQSDAPRRKSDGGDALDIPEPHGFGIAMFIVAALVLVAVAVTLIFLLLT